MPEQTLGLLTIDEDFYEQRLIEIFVDELDYTYLHGPDVNRTSERFDDVYLPEILPAALRKVNPTLHQAAIQEAINKLTASNPCKLEYRNKAFTDWIQSGVEVHYFDGHEERDEIVYLIDYDHPDANSFHIVNQWTFVEYSEKRPDLIVFINGIPVVIFELKSPARQEVDASDAYLQLRNYMKQIPSLFVPNIFCVMSDMADTRVGTITASEDRFVAWKSIDGEHAESDYAKYQTLLKGMFPKARLLDIIRNFICFNDTEDKTVKILAGYHQYFAVGKAAKRAVEAVAGDGRIGVFWHTQGSGKSLSMVFLAHMLQKRLESPTIVVITDRNDLDDQLYGQFSRCRDFLRQTPVQATSREHLKDLLIDRAANGIIFTTMQKFEEGDGPLCNRSNVIVMVDEAHRGQYGLEERIDKDGKVSYGAARLVREALPNASFIGFTGTPIETDDKNTREIFGDYIDVYDMTQAVEDGATRPVYYESRVVALHLDQSALDDLDQAYENYAQYEDLSTVERSKHTMAALEGVLGAQSTIEALCTDIITHYEANRADLLTGKALVVAYSRPIAIKIYHELLRQRPEWAEKVGVVMTMSNQDPEDWFDICGGKDHKKEMERRFKSDSPDETLKIAIVVDMWLTGFDVPSLGTMYVFKPMKGHNLMQAIARVNRVYKGKEGGLVVDYIGIAGALKQAMKDYTERDRDNYDEMDIAKTALPKFHEKLEVIRDILHGLHYRDVIFTGQNSVLAKAITDGVDWLLAPSRHDDMEDFLEQARYLHQALQLCKSLLSADEQHEAAFIEVLRVQVLHITQPNTPPGGGSGAPEFNRIIKGILEASVHNDGVIDLFDKDKVEISLFDEAFLTEIAAMKQKNIAFEALRRLIEEQVKRYKHKSVVKSQMFSEMLQGTINRYLNGMLTNAEVIEELIQMAIVLMEDRDEAKRLGLDEEELAFYDALSKPQAVKDFYSNDQLVAITRELTEAMRKSATIDWQQKESARAGMRRAIKRLLRKYKYPPEGVDDALQTVMAQCELWADSKVFD